MSKLRVRLALVMISLVGLAVLSSGVFAAKLMRDSLLESMHGQMMQQLTAVREQLDSAQAAQSAAAFDRVVTSFERTWLTKITLVRTDGTFSGEAETATLAIRLAEKPYIVRYSSVHSENRMYVNTNWRSAPNDNAILLLSASIAHIEQSSQRLWNALMIGIVVIFLLAALISWRMARGITRPLENITDIAREMTSFQFRTRALAHHNDEVGELGFAINMMADSLETQLRQIRENENKFKTVLDNMITGIILLDDRHVVTLMNNRAEHMIDYEQWQLIGQSYMEMKHPTELQTLITQCVESRQSLREELTIFYPHERIVEINIVPVFLAVQEYRGMIVMIHDITTIRKLEMMRREFVANVSHEIKTPLTALKGFAETLLSGTIADEATARSFLQIIHNEADRLNRLIIDILQLSKMESGKFPLNYTPLEMQPFISKVIKMLAVQAAAKDIVLQSDVPPELYVEADEDRLTQIIINLLSNGINYTPSGGKVSVTVMLVESEAVDDLGAEKVRIVVADTGIGIPKQDQQRIFERFYRVDKARSRESGGTGLGLSIVKHLVELHKGTISVDSRPGMGSQFVIELPLIQM